MSDNKTDVKNTGVDARSILANLSTQDFLNIGIDQIAYVRPVVLDDHEMYSIHAADGTQLSVLDSFDTAVDSIKNNEMHPVTLH